MMGTPMDALYIGHKGGDISPVTHVQYSATHKNVHKQQTERVLQIYESIATE